MINLSKNTTKKQGQPNGCPFHLIMIDQFSVTVGKLSLTEGSVGDS